MEKQNIFCSSLFHMNSGDKLHVIVKDLTGSMPIIELSDKNGAVEDTHTDPPTGGGILEAELVSVSDGAHKICFGLDGGELSAFGVQLYLTKYGKQAVDWVERLSLGWISFLRGDLWIQNSPNVDRNEFFTEHKDAVVGVVINEQPDVIKILDSIGIHTNKEWEVTSVTIPESMNYPNGMSSRIPKERFEKREGVFRSEFLRNELSTNGTANVLDLLRGEEMRGQVAIIELTNTSTDEVRLFKIETDMTSSKI